MDQCICRRCGDQSATVRDMFAGMELVEFSVIANGKDSIGMLTNPDDSVVQRQEFGCGRFWFRKTPAQPPLNR